MLVSTSLEYKVTEIDAGFYFFRIQAGSYIETKKMVLMKSSIEE
jgi:hypothetical protein